MSKKIYHNVAVMSDANKVKKSCQDLEWEMKNYQFVPIYRNWWCNLYSGTKNPHSSYPGQCRAIYRPCDWKIPFRIHTVRTDTGHEFPSRFHWYVEDLGIRHVYSKPRKPYLNGKVERSHLTDEQEFYQLLSYTDDVDLQKKLKVWDDFYTLNRPSSLKEKTPFEVMWDKLSC